jgi:hypothetical protein
MIDFVVWVLQNIALAPYYLFVAITNPGAWLNWSNPEAVMHFVYYGASVEFFFVVFTTFLVITAVGAFWSREFLWGCVRVLEGFANAIGRFAAWAGLIMVLQQVMIVFLQRIFRVSEISLGPLGTVIVVHARLVLVVGGAEALQRHDRVPVRELYLRARWARAGRSRVCRGEAPDQKGHRYGG